MCERASKQTTDQKIYTAPGPPLDYNFVLFQTKIESYINWKEFLNCSDDKYLIEVQIYVKNWIESKCNTAFHQ